MKSFIVCALLSSMIFVASAYERSSTSVVCVSGAIIKSRWSNKEKKYPRDECPVCLGKGWYMSGDDITRVDCGYCEPKISSLPAKNGPVCKDGKCNTQIYKK